MRTQKDVAEVLSRVHDPELGIGIVSLGLIYSIDVGAGEIGVEMSATSEACPMASLIQSAAQERLEDAFPGERATVTMVDEPRWDAAMLDEPARERLGLGARKPR